MGLGMQGIRVGMQGIWKEMREMGVKMQGIWVGIRGMQGMWRMGTSV